MFEPKLAGERKVPFEEIGLTRVKSLTFYACGNVGRLVEGSGSGGQKRKTGKVLSAVA